MRVAVTSEYHFGRDGAGVVATDGVYPYAHTRRLLAAFDDVTVIARVGDGTPPRLAAEGPRVGFCALRDARGPRALLGAAPAWAPAIAAAVRAADAVILRAPGVVATIAWLAARALGRPYGIQVVGDPRESLREIAGGRAAAPAAAVLRRQVAGACAVTYVTREALQRRYPARAGAPTFAVSEVEIPDDVLAAPAPAIAPGPALRVAFVAILTQRYKGLDWLLAAIARTRHPHALTVVGDGPLRGESEALAARLGLAGRVRFAGGVAGPAEVRRVLADHDLLVVPSRTEGLPRVLLEGMAVGLPCVGTPVGGIPELLDAEDLVAVDDVAGLADAIDRAGVSPARRAAMAARGRARAAPYRASERDRRLHGFYAAVAAAIRR